MITRITIPETTQDTTFFTNAPLWSVVVLPADTVRVSAGDALRSLTELSGPDQVRQSACSRRGQGVRVEPGLWRCHLGSVAERESDVAGCSGRQVRGQLDGTRYRPASRRAERTTGTTAVVVQVGRVEDVDSIGGDVEFGVGSAVVERVQRIGVVEHDPDILRAVARVGVGRADRLGSSRQEPIVVQHRVGAADLDRADGSLDGSRCRVAEVCPSGGRTDHSEGNGNTECAKSSDDPSLFQVHSFLNLCRNFQARQACIRPDGSTIFYYTRFSLNVNTIYDTLLRIRLLRDVLLLKRI